MERQRRRGGRPRKGHGHRESEGQPEVLSPHRGGGAQRGRVQSEGGGYFTQFTYFSLHFQPPDRLLKRQKVAGQDEN